MSDLRIEVTPGVVLEARWDAPERPHTAVVFCHPHPQHDGTMQAPLMRAVAAHLAADGFAVLRFNFRGVGASTGRWSEGAGEMDDVAAAVDLATTTHPDLPIGLAGWSFGAATGLLWQARDRRGIDFVGIAPPVSNELTPPLPGPDELPPARRSFVLGDRDQFVTVEELEGYADSIDAVVHVLKGSDHFFFFREERVADLVAEGLRPRRGSGRLEPQ
jgi:uncharacterized protein